MTRSLKIAVIGAGRMGRLRAKATELFGAQVRYVCDPVTDIAQELATSLHDAQAIVTPSDLDWNEIDAVFVCTPPSERGCVELAAIEHRVPFFVEKPVGLSTDAVAAIEAALKTTPMLTAVGYMNRCRKSVQVLQAWARQQPILGISMDWLVGMYGVPWWSKKEGSGGPINEQATHLLDLARHIVGEISAVQTLPQPNPAYPDLIGAAAINLQFQSGTVGSILYSCLAREKMIRVHLYSDTEQQTLQGWDFRMPSDDSTAVDYDDRNQIFDIETAQFLQAVGTGAGTSSLSCFADALRTQRVVDAIHRSAQTGCLERVAEVRS